MASVVADGNVPWPTRKVVDAGGLQPTQDVTLIADAE